MTVASVGVVVSWWTAVVLWSVLGLFWYRLGLFGLHTAPCLWRCDIVGQMGNKDAI